MKTSVHLRAPIVRLTGLGLLGAALLAFAASAGAGLSTDRAGSAGALRSISAGGTTLIMGRATDIFGFDPVVQGDGTSIYTDLQVYDQLAELQPDGKTIAPGLASSWKYSNGGKIITFTLRPGVRFSDGSPLKASDVVFSLKRSTDPKSSYGSLFGGVITSIKAVGANKIQLRMSKPFAPLLGSLSLWLGSVYSEKNWKKWGKQASQHPIGTGPYQLQSWVKGSTVTLVPNKYYWGKPKPSIRKIVFKVIGDQSARALALQSHSVDMIDVVPPNQVSAIQNSGQKIARVLGAAVLPVSLNQNKVPAFKDKNVRLALAYSIDREAIVKAAYFGQAAVAKSVFPSATFFWDPKGAVTYDMTKAAQYLKQSGFANGFSFKVIVPSGGSPETTVAQIWQQSLSKLGIQMTIDTLDQTTAYQAWNGETYEATLTPTWVNDTPDAFEFAQYTVSATEPTGIGGFHMGYVNPTARALALKGQTTLDPKARQKIYSQLQAIYNTDEPLLYIVDTPVLYGLSPKVKNFTPNRAGNGNYYFNRVTISG